MTDRLGELTTMDVAIRGVDVEEATRMLTTYDVRWACDVMRPAYDESRGVDGRVSIEVDPRLAYERYEKKFSSERWQALADAGAHPQRPLWASTSTKNPEYRDVMYVEELIAPGVVNTMPESTLHAFADHGEVRGDTITGYYADAQRVLDDLAAVGVDYNDVVDTLEREGVEKF